MHHNFVWLFCFTFNFTGCVCLCMLEFVLELSCFLFVIYLPVAFITAATFFKAKKVNCPFYTQTHLLYLQICQTMQFET